MSTSARLDQAQTQLKEKGGFASGALSLDKVVLDGSTGEGGGQILRNAISYATIFLKDLEITQIRAKRTKPGLRAQHTASIQLPVALCGGTLTGDVVGSSTIAYSPSPPPQGGDPNVLLERTITKDIGTAGSICLLLQASLPCALMHASQKTRLTLVGGTNATLAPQYDYWHDVFLPILKKQCGLDEDQVQGSVECRGYFPRGGGKVHVVVHPLMRPLKPMQLTERGDVESIHIRSFHAGKLPRHLADDMAKAAQKQLREHGLSKHTCTVDIVTESCAVGSALGILIVATTSTGCKLAGSALSAPGKKSYEVGREAAQELVRALESGGCVDEWMQDQLILYMALANGVSEMVTGCLTLHTQTAIWTAQQFCGEALFEVQKLDENTNKQKQEQEPKNSRKRKENPVRPTHHGKAQVEGDEENYGHDGLVPGRHLIRCHGIGFKRPLPQE